MSSRSKQQLLETLDKISGLELLVVGDLILDRYLWGKVSRISPEAPVPIVDVYETEDRLGGAGNVARNLCQLGAKVSISAVVGDDLQGKAILELLEKSEIEHQGIIVDRDRNTTLKTRVIAHGQQVVRIDRETKEELKPELQKEFAALVEAQIDRTKAIIISDYGKGVVSAILMKRLAEACKSGRLSLAKKPLVVDPHPANYQHYIRMNVAKPNRAEAELATGIVIKTKEQAIQAAEILLKRWESDLAMITLGEDGLVIAFADKSPAILIETVAHDIYDVSGAGDTVTALFTAALAVGATPQVAGDLANIAAGIVISEVGTVAINPKKLRQEIDYLES